MYAHHAPTYAFSHPKWHTHIYSHTLTHTYTYICTPVYPTSTTFYSHTYTHPKINSPHTHIHIYTYANPSLRHHVHFQAYTLHSFRLGVYAHISKLKLRGFKTYLQILIHFLKEKFKSVFSSQFHPFSHDITNSFSKMCLYISTFFYHLPRKTIIVYLPPHIFQAILLYLIYYK